MRHLFLSLFILMSIGLMAQTKKIAFKSHSGNAENFQVTLDNELFDMDNSNFGEGPAPEVRRAQLDSLIFVSDSVAIMITSDYCPNPRYRYNDDSTKLWHTGKLAVYNHPLFSQQHSLDNIKKVLEERYHFRNDIEKVVFVGYDNKKPQDKRNELLPANLSGDKNDPLDKQAMLILGLVFSASLFAGLIAWKYKRPQGRMAI